MLAHIAAALRAGRSKAAAYKACNVWARRVPLVDAALSRLAYGRLVQAVHMAARLDRIMKGREQGDIWLTLESLSLVLCDVVTASDQAVS